MFEHAGRSVIDSNGLNLPRIIRNSPSVLFLLLWIGGALGNYPPMDATKGEIWPLPQQQIKLNGSFVINAASFRFQSTAFECDILHKAYGRYLDIIFPARNSVPNRSRKSNLPLVTLDVELIYECEYLPHPAMDEMYQLKICTTNDTTKAFLYSLSVWGILRGLETFSQLVMETDDPEVFVVPCTEIVDFPRFTHRGLMLDTSRHFIPVEKIQDTLDLMAMNKFNVFHWHIVDDQSFPFQSTIYPNLAFKGAWTPHHIYTGEEIDDLVEYARIRGIRILVEFDTPGHTKSWGKGYPGLLANCNSDSDTSGLIDPSKEENYKFLQNLFGEIARRFPDPHIHLGGDEVHFSCWQNNPYIEHFMSVGKMRDDHKKLLDYYFSRLQNIVLNIDTINGMHVWQEVFDNNVKLFSNTIIHVWVYPGNSDLYFKEMSKVTHAGYRAVLSACWYLNYISYGEDWKKYYSCDPHDFLGTPMQHQLVMGGEACLWAEFLDETNIISTTWPRASAVAEKLWSPQEKTWDATSAEPRLLEHRCRLFKRGYSVQPIRPSFCQRNPNGV